MRTILFVFAVSFCFIHVCCGRYQGLGLYSTNRRGVPFRDLSQSDEKCADDPDYAKECEKMARFERWCSDQVEVTKELCAKSCDWCSDKKVPSPVEETVEPSTASKAPAPTEETVKPSTAPKAPAPTVCDDDPAYAARCPEFAEIKNYCDDQKKFMSEHCARSCKFCKKEETVEPSTASKAPAPTEETVKPSTPPKAPAPTVCENNPKWASKCPEWAEMGNCITAERFMKEYCKKSCGFTCETEETVEPSTPPKAPAPTEETVKPSTPPKAPAPTVCEDKPKWASKCPEWAEMGNCKKAEIFMEEYCKKSCGFPCEPEPTSNPETKPPSPPGFCRDRDVNCKTWMDKGFCKNPRTINTLKIYCGVTCDFCKAPTPEECYDKIDNCHHLKENGDCSSTLPEKEYNVKTNCLETCEFCVPDLP